MTTSIHWLDQNSGAFPHYQYALTEPNGLLAAGGDLSPERLINAYSLGIFPWYNPGEPILWWTPDPRSVVYPQEFKPSRSLTKLIKKQLFSVTMDTCFAEVIKQCAQPRRDQDGTWIDDDINQAYNQLHDLGLAHSVEVWLDGALVGGLYGIALGKAFFGESMFSRVDNASKLAFATLCEQLTKWQFELIDCQVHNPHLASLGAVEIPRKTFLAQLKRAIEKDEQERWHLD
ncbi:MAG: leucyl/phenylalanyl-tRNA--protein transferase, partial [Bermanella sp.]